MGCSQMVIELAAGPPPPQIHRPLMLKHRFNTMVDIDRSGIPKVAVICGVLPSEVRVLGPLLHSTHLRRVQICWKEGLAVASRCVQSCTRVAESSTSTWRGVTGKPTLPQGPLQAIMPSRGGGGGGEGNLSGGLHLQNPAQLLDTHHHRKPHAPPPPTHTHSSLT